MLYQIITKDGILRTIKHDAICTNAEFQLDRPIVLEPGQLFELHNGMWFTVKNNKVVRINGRWKHG